jgi:hypothetical protein
MSPALLAHADWSVDCRKRWMAVATRQPDGRYRLRAAQRVGPLTTLLERLEAEAVGGPVLVGFDFPIGLPRAYADRAGIDDFVKALPCFGKGRWPQFYDVACSPAEIGLDRPFYPMTYKSKGLCRQQLPDGLGLACWLDLLRRCDRRSATRSAACALFWTLGGQQVGKAAIAGWRDLLAPTLRNGLDLALWPFQGSLHELLARHRFVVAETYPAEFYRHLGLSLKNGKGNQKVHQQNGKSPLKREKGGKGNQKVRQRNAEALLKWTKCTGVDLDPAPHAEIKNGFGDDSRGDDRFDAVIGLFGMLNVVLGQRASGEPDDPVVRRIEGWILGQSAA